MNADAHTTGFHRESGFRSVKTFAVKKDAVAVRDVCPEKNDICASLDAFMSSLADSLYIKGRYLFATSLTRQVTPTLSSSDCAYMGNTVFSFLTFLFNNSNAGIAIDE